MTERIFTLLSVIRVLRCLGKYREGAVNLTIDNVLFWTSKLLRDVRVGKT